MYLPAGRKPPHLRSRPHTERPELRSGNPVTARFFQRRVFASVMLKTHDGSMTTSQVLENHTAISGEQAQRNTPSRSGTPPGPTVTPRRGRLIQIKGIDLSTRYSLFEQRTIALLMHKRHFVEGV